MPLVQAFLVESKWYFREKRSWLVSWLVRDAAPPTLASFYFVHENFLSGILENYIKFPSIYSVETIMQ